MTDTLKSSVVRSGCPVVLTQNLQRLKGAGCKAAFPYTVPSTDASLLSTDASPCMVLTTDGSEHRLIPAKNRYGPVRQLVSQSDS